MTMPNAFHPDDERLAAYAGGDADTVSDGALVEHLSTCDRCRPIVDELTLLRGALAALPDLAPSRPLRLIPPVPAAAPRASGPLAWLGRLATPAMAAGAGLVLVGAVGMSGLVADFRSASGALTAADRELASPAAPAPGQAAESVDLYGPNGPANGPDYAGKSASPDDGAAVTGSEPPGSRDGESAAPAASEPSASRGEEGAVGTPSTGRNGEQPWLTVMIAGAALLGVATVLRFTLVPRAG